MAEAEAKDGGFKIEGDWKREMNRFIGRLGGISTSWRRMPPEVQNEAANIIADLYKKFIREGISPENTMLTQIVSGIHPPLSGLADYIVVIPTGPNRGTGTYPGRPKPALITWHKDWLKIAFLHDRGYTFAPTQMQRRMLFERAKQVVGSEENFLEEGFSQGGLWTIPARPHSQFLASALLDRILLAIAEAKMRGLPFDTSSKRPPSEPYKAYDRVGGNRANIDDMRDL